VLNKFIIFNSEKADFVNVVSNKEIQLNLKEKENVDEQNVIKTQI
jgi:hypothetical protein